MPFEKEYFKDYREQSIRWDFWADFTRKNLKKNAAVLEIGCAYGYLSRRLEADYRTYGLDISSHAIKVARTIAPKTKFYVMGAEKMRLNKGTFAIIFCMDVLEHLKTPSKCVAECARLLLPNGLLVVSVPNTASLLKRLKGKDWFGYSDKTHVSLLSPKEWERMFREGGFDVKSKFSDGFFDIPYFRHVPLLVQKAFLVPGWLQYKLKLPFLRGGENMVFICRKRA